MEVGYLAVDAVSVANVGGASIPREAKSFPAAGWHAQGVTVSQRGGDPLSYTRGCDFLSWFFSALKQDGTKHQETGVLQDRRGGNPGWAGPPRPHGHPGQAGGQLICG